MIRILVVLMALFLAVPAAAHQQKITLSTITHNARTDMLEVVHRVPLHDAEHVLEARGSRAPDIINDIESRRAFARYLTSRFLIAHDDEPVELTVLGSEIDGGHLLVYQEAMSPGPGADLTIQSQVLTDMWSRQENRVNLGSGAKVITLVFHSGDAVKRAALP